MTDGAQVLVAGDGSVLPGQTAQSSVPEIKLDGARVRGPPRARARPWTRCAWREPRRSRCWSASPTCAATRRAGSWPASRTGPELIFGTAERIGAKWAAAARVLADPDAAGAEYVDLRIPERPAAGGLPVETLAPVAPAGSPEPADPALDPAAAAPPASRSPSPRRCPWSPCRPPRSPPPWRPSRPPRTRPRSPPLPSVEERARTLNRDLSLAPSLKLGSRVRAQDSLHGWLTRSTISTYSAEPAVIVAG